MPQLIIPNTIANGQDLDAPPVQQNFSTIETFTNTQLINRDGSVPMAQPLTLSGAPTQPLHAATKAYADALVPVGVVMPYAGEAAPNANWRICDGQPLTTAGFPALFAVLGYRFGGAGANFNLPDLRSRFPLGRDTREVPHDTTGKTGGTRTVVLPQHDHTIGGHSHTIASHTHTMAHTHAMSHSHSIDHGHTATSGAVGNHSHDLAVRWNSTGSGGVGEPMISNSTGTDSVKGVAGAGAHNHAIAVQGFIGNSGASSIANTAGSSAANTGGSGQLSTSSTSAGNTGNAGTSGASMLPPFQVLNYIIKVL